MKNPYISNLGYICNCVNGQVFNGWMCEENSCPLFDCMMRRTAAAVLGPVQEVTSAHVWMWAAALGGSVALVFATIGFVWRQRRQQEQQQLDLEAGVESLLREMECEQLQIAAPELAAFTIVTEKGDKSIYEVGASDV